MLIVGEGHDGCSSFDDVSDKASFFFSPAACNGLAWPGLKL